MYTEREKREEKTKKLVPFITTSIMQDLTWAILLIPLWWILGIRFFIFHFLSLWVFVKLLIVKHRDKDKFIFPSECYFLMAFITLYVASFFINLVNIPLFRASASLYNLSFWIAGLLIILVIYNSIDKESILRFLKSFQFFGIVCSLFVLSAHAFWIFTHKYLSVKSLLYWLLPDRFIELVKSKALLLLSSLELGIVGRDKLFQKPFPRSPGFNVYSAALGITMVFMIVMTLAYYKTRKKRSSMPFILFLESVALILSLSRMSILAVGAAWLIVFSVVNINKSSYRIIIASVSACIVILLILVPPKKIGRTFLEFRDESTTSRVKLYKITFKQSLKKPIFGYGFKPRTEEVPIPVGSHSTYIGVIYKTGFLGLFAIILFWISILRRWWVQRKSLSDNGILRPIWFYSGIALIGGYFWMAVEDLDAPPIVAFFYFIIIGIILSLNKMKEVHKET